MIDHLLACTLTALVALTVVFTLRRQSARYRHAILLVALLRFAVPTPWLMKAGGALVRCLPSRSAATTVDELAGLLLRFEAGAAHLTPVPAPHGLAWDRLAWIIWSAGVAASLTWWARRWPRTVKVARPPTAAEQEAWAAARTAINLRFPVELRIVGSDRSPAALGWWRPCVVLPSGLSEQLDSGELHALLSHELAHIHRRDNLLAALAHVVASTFWFHPMVWWMERRMLAERETACDELVLAQGSPAEEYAAAILKVCRSGYQGALGYAGIASSNLQQRMEHIMSVNLSRHSTRLAALPGVLATFAILLPLAAGFLHAQAPQTRQSEADALERSAMACLERKDFAQAEVEFRKLLALEPGDVRGVTGLAETYMAEHRTSDAVQFMQSQAGRFRSSAVYERALGNLLTRGGRFDEGIAAFRGSLENDPGNAETLLSIGEAYRRKGDLGTAIEYFRRAYQAAPNDPRALLQLALVLDGTGQRDSAVEMYTKLLAFQPDHPVALNNLAYIESQTGGDLDRALARAERARQKMPDSIDIADTVGTIYLKKRMAEPAIATFTWALRKDAGNETFRTHLADALALKPNLTASEQELLALLRGKPSDASSQRILEFLQ